MKFIMCLLVLAMSSTGYSADQNFELICREIKKSSQKPFHFIFSRPTALIQVGFDDLGPIYVAKDLKKDFEKKRAHLIFFEEGFRFGSDEFVQVSEGVFEGQLEQTNGSSIYGTFSSIHTVRCEVI